MNDIKPSHTKWVSPVVFAPNMERSLRFCVEYRILNAITVRYSHTLPRMDECIDSLGDAQVFSTLDANNAYFQIEVDKSYQEKTAFTSNHG